MGLQKVLHGEDREEQVASWWGPDLEEGPGSKGSLGPTGDAQPCSQEPPDSGDTALLPTSLSR